MSARHLFTFWTASALGALILLAVAVIHGYHRNSAARWDSFLVGDPHEGSLLFFEKKGSRVVTQLMASAPNAAPDLGFSQSPRSSVAQIVSAMWNHAPKMWESVRAQRIAYPDLDREDMANLFAFLYTAHYVDEPDDGRRGALLFTSKQGV